MVVKTNIVALVACLFALSADSAAKERVEAGGFGNITIDMADNGDGESPGTHVYGGILANRKFPWMVSLQYVESDSSFTHVCGASLIAEKWILTAAHCRNAFNRACIGGRNLQQLNQEFECFDIRRVVIHPDYKAASFENDLQVVEIDGTTDRTPVRLNTDATAQSTEPGAKGYVIGWGLTEDSRGNAAEYLHYLDVTLNSLESCDVFAPPIPSPLKRTSLCDTGVKGKAPCNGDSGGPLISTTTTESLIGLVSFGSKDCSKGVPSVYVNVRMYLNWISSVTGVNFGTDETACSTKPCQNGGTCVDATGTDAGYFCKCGSDFSGKNCEFKNATPAGKAIATSGTSSSSSLGHTAAVVSGSLAVAAAFRRMIFSQ
eukprot:comp21594_c0_seq1/m.30224 comp21594_c0_seq1/g.30224  ORF comp21594_c0_seq1/g.30224 comp21594_c0_seq1/m.30224 type:complete len:374 (-) comp21594_c0_seq1:163-1284(-)